MDPYLEDPSLWPDVHAAMLVGIRAQLNARLPERYVALLDRHVWLHEPDADERLLLGKAVREQGQRYVRIIDRDRRRVITVIEFLSPSNKKAGADRENYLGKQNEYLATGTNLVEIDLRRAGARLPLGEPPPAEADYYGLVSRATEFPRAGFWSFSVRNPFPALPVPLGPQDAAIPLELKPCLDRAYDEGRYAGEVDYTQPPTPPLPEADATWSRQLLAARTPGTHHGEQP
jgi:hypothetical protein